MVVDYLKLNLDKFFSSLGLLCLFGVCMQILGKSALQTATFSRSTLMSFVLELVIHHGCP
jgi:hypothetical protein